MRFPAPLQVHCCDTCDSARNKAESEMQMTVPSQAPALLVSSGTRIRSRGNTATSWLPPFNSSSSTTAEQTWTFTSALKLMKGKERSWHHRGGSSPAVKLLLSLYSGCTSLKVHARGLCRPKPAKAIADRLWPFTPRLA